MRAVARGSLAALLAGLYASAAAGDALACSPVPRSLYRRYTEHAKVLVGTVLRKSPSGKDTYSIRVDEAFKGMPEASGPAQVLPIPFNIRGQCGFDAPKEGDRALLFMNDGDIVSSTSGSFFIWREAAQPKPYLNPVLDEVVLLRRMLAGDAPRPVVPDEETAVHLALKALLPAFGQERLEQSWPLRATYQGGTPGEETWRVTGTTGGKLPPLEAEIDKWTGDVKRIGPRT